MVMFLQDEDQILQERLRFLEQSKEWALSQWKEYQGQELKRLMVHAAAHVPYYRELFARLGIRPDAFQEADLGKIPIVAKDNIKENPKAFLADNYKAEDIFYLTSGGSTGNPLAIWMDHRYKAFNHANTRFYMNMYGLKPDTFKSVRLHGDSLSDDLIKRSEYWQQQGLRLVMSSYHISEQTVHAYVAKINEYQPLYIHAFPSALSLLAHLMKQMKLQLNFKLQYIFCDCETLYPAKQKLIEEVFGCSLMNIYGHTEGSVLATSCLKSGDMHVHPHMGICQLLYPDGTPVTRPGDRGEIVVTGFNNYVMPFIRYRTYDLGILAKPCACGWPHLSLSQVEGRIHDYVVNDRGAIVPLAPALFDYIVDWSGVIQFQVVQNKPGELTFKLLRSASAKESKEAMAARIAKQFMGIFNHAFKIDVVFVDDLGFTRVGKFRYLDQKLDIAGEFFKSHDQKI